MVSTNQSIPQLEIQDEPERSYTRIFSKFHNPNLTLLKGFLWFHSKLHIYPTHWDSTWIKKTKRSLYYLTERRRGCNTNVWFRLIFYVNTKPFSYITDWKSCLDKERFLRPWRCLKPDYWLILCWLISTGYLKIFHSNWKTSRCMRWVLFFHFLFVFVIGKYHRHLVFL